jgi:hypothetical protein
MTPKRLEVNGVKLHPRFSRLVLGALVRLENLERLPPPPKGHLYFEASDGSLHSIPRKHLTAARHLDPGLIPWKKGVPQFRKDEAELFRTLHFLVFAS